MDSIFDQNYDGKINLLIRDDGSSDNTIEIIKNHPRYKTGEIEVIQGENVGPQKSFLKLIKCVSSDYDYYFFSDQDDIWNRDKIETSIDKLNITDEPEIYCSNYCLTDKDLNIINPRGIGATPDFSPIRCLLYNEIPGCCMALNRSLMYYLKEINIDNVMMHDSMALFLASYIGKIIYDETPRIKHRIHDANVVGTGHKKIEPCNWIKEKSKLLLKGESYDISELAEEVLKVGKNLGKDFYLNDLILLRDYKKKFSKTIELLSHEDTKGKLFDRTVMSIRCKIFFHLF